jgi:hypothetical protein
LKQTLAIGTIKVSRRLSIMLVEAILILEELVAWPTSDMGRVVVIFESIIIIEVLITKSAIRMVQFLNPVIL